MSEPELAECPTCAAAEQRVVLVLSVAPSPLPSARVLRCPVCRWQSTLPSYTRADEA